MKKHLFYLAILLGPLFGISQPTNFLVLDGTETINIPDTNEINKGTFDNRTVEFWFKVDDNSTGTRQMIYKEGGPTRGINFWVDGGKIFLGMWNDASDGEVDVWHGTWFREDIDSNKWYHVALVLKDADSDDGNSGDELKWYLDGVLQDEANGGVLHPHANDIYLGSNKNDGVYPSNSSLWVAGVNSDIYEALTNGDSPTLSPDLYFKGAIGLLRVWNSARTQAEISDNRNTIYTTADLNNASDYLVAFLNGDSFEYVDSGGGNAETDGGTEGNAGITLPKATPTDYVWDGYEDSDWNNPNNWIPVSLPEIGDNIKIEIENADYDGIDVDPVFPSGMYYYNNFEVSAASTFDAGSSSEFNISGYFSNSGTVAISGSSFINNGYVYNVGTFDMDGGKITVSDGANGGIVNNLGGTFNFKSGEIVNGGEYDLSGTFYSFINWDATSTFVFGTDAKYTGTLSTATFDNQGVITLKSDATGTGSLITNGAITNSGSINVERYIDGGTKWQLVSSPMDAEKSEVFYGHFLNSYDEANGDFNAIRSRNDDLNTGEGFVVKWKDEFASGTNPLVFSNDKPFTGDKDVALITYTGGDGESNTYFHLPLGFNLVGNPYPSNLSMVDVWTYNRDHASGNDIDATFYYYQESGGWQVYNASTNIPVDDPNRYVNLGQGFGVILSGNNALGGTLRIPNGARSHEIGNGFNKKASVPSVNNYFEFNSNTSGGSSKIYFRFNESSTSGYDGLYDAHKINSFDNIPNPYFVSSDDKRLAICEMPESESVNIGFNMAISGDVTFSLSNVNDFTEIILEDKQEGTFTDLMKVAYTFNYSDEDAETGRFTLHFKQETLKEEKELTGMKVFSDKNKIYLQSDIVMNNVDVVLYNISGQVILSKHFDTLKKEELNINLNGVFILKLNSSRGAYTSKLILN